MTVRFQLLGFDVDVGDREDLFDRVVGDLHAIGRVTERAAAVRSLAEREAMQSTAIGDGVAFPHARCAACPETVLAAVRLRQPIPFDAPDERPVDLVFLMLGPDGSPMEHVQRLGALARLVRTPGVVEALREAGDEDAFRRALTPPNRSREIM